MQTKEDENELIRLIAQQCARCKAGRARMVCTKKSCHNRKVREWLKLLDKLQNNRRNEQCRINQGRA